MFRAISIRALLPILALFLPADLVAAPPREGVQSIFPLLSDEECWRKISPTEKGGVQGAAVVGSDDGRCDAPDDGRNAAPGLRAPDA